MHPNQVGIYESKVSFNTKRKELKNHKRWVKITWLTSILDHENKAYIFNKLGIEGNFLNYTESIYKTSSTNIP